MILVNPNTGKPVDVAEAFIDRLTLAGFKEQEPEAVEKDSAPASKRRGRPRKSE
jgi:hypothetical protein